MDIELFVLCDAATEMGGKMNLLGTFDTITSPAMPAVHPHCALALRLRFYRIEEGQHSVRINIADEDGRMVVPGLEGNLMIRFGPQDRSAVANLVLNLNQLKFDKAGEYSINLAMDGRQEKSLPLFVKLREKPATLPPPSKEDSPS